MVLGVGTRWSDFTTASRSIFANDDVRFINLNVAPIDSTKHAGLPLLADARVGLEALTEALEGASWETPAFAWDAVVERAYTLGHTPLPAQSEVIGVVNRVSRPARRRRLRGGLDARRPAQALAHARPEGLPRRVRLLDDGLRDRRRPRA